MLLSGICAAPRSLVRSADADSDIDWESHARGHHDGLENRCMPGAEGVFSVSGAIAAMTWPSPPVLRVLKSAGESLATSGRPGDSGGDALLGRADNGTGQRGSVSLETKGVAEPDVTVRVVSVNESAEGVTLVKEEADGGVVLALHWRDDGLELAPSCPPFGSM